MNKLLATVFALIIIVAAWFLFTGNISVPVSNPQYKKIKILNENRIVCKIYVDSGWSFSTQLSTAPTGIDRWRKVILLSQTDYMKYLSNQECLDLYGRSEISSDQLDSQRAYVVDRFRNYSITLSITKIYVALDTETKTCRMIVPISGPQGDYFTTFELIRGDWHVVPGVGGIDWEAANAKEIIRAIEAESLEYVPVKDFDSLMRGFTSTYLPH